MSPAATETTLDGVRYDARAPRPMVESYFLKANDPGSRRALWVRATIFAGEADPARALAETWAVAFDPEHGHVAVKTQVPFAQARFDARRVDVAVDGMVLDEQRTEGVVASGGRRVAWSLQLERRGAPLVHFHDVRLYDGPFPSYKLLSPLPDARAAGFVEVQGRRWDVSGWPAMLGHNWGRGHAHAYAWAHCNAWDGDEDVELVFEGTSARVKAGPVLLPTTTLLLVRHRGVRYELNTPVDLVRNRGHIGALRWHFAGRGKHSIVSGEIWAEREDFVGLFYPNPDRSLTYCLNTKIARAQLRLELSGRAPMVVASSRAALEIGTRSPDHGITMYV